MGHEGREREFEQALQRHLRRDAAAARNEADAHAAVPDDALRAAECLDAATLAAFHERTLAGSEIVAVKEHLATCSRCQEILLQLEATDEILLPAEAENDLKKRESVLSTGALYVDYAARQTPGLTAPAAPASSLKAPDDISRGRGFKALRWATPAGAIAAGLLIWIVVRDNKTQAPSHSENVQIAQEQARDDERPALRPLPASPVPPAPAPGSKALNGPRKDAAMTRQLAGEPGAVRAQERYSPNVKAKSANRVAASSNSSISAATPNSTANTPMGARDLSNLIALATPPKAEPQPPKQSTDTGSASAAPINTSSADLTNQSAAPAPSASSASANAPDKKADADSARTTQTIIDEGYSLPTEQIATADKLREPTFETSGKAALAKTVLAHGGTVLWRLRAKGQIVRSVDGGVTWVRQDSGVKVELLAGSAPSESVCWIVGRGGAILRTTDGGGHWNKVVSPVRGDVARVQAADAMTAEIFSADESARFVTHDGGVTWQAAKE
jgi:Photosynthesis system II assembly factor YCF48